MWDKINTRDETLLVFRIAGLIFVFYFVAKFTLSYSPQINFAQSIFDGLVTILVAFVGVWLPLYIQKKKDRKRAFNFFKGMLNALILECGSNLASIKKIRSSVSSGHLFIDFLTNQVLKKVVDNEMSYRYFSQDFFYGLHSCRVLTGLVTTRQQIMIEQQLKGEHFDQIGQMALLENCNSLKKVILLIQIQIQLFINIFEAKLGPLVGGRIFFERLRKVDEESAEKLIEELRAIGEMDKSEIILMKRKYREAYKNTHGESPSE